MGNEQTPQPPSGSAAPYRSAGHEASIVGTAHTWFLDRIGGLWALCTHRPISLYAASVLRIGYGLRYPGSVLLARAILMALGSSVLPSGSITYQTGTAYC